MNTRVKEAVKAFFQKATDTPDKTFSLSLGGVSIDEETRAWIITECPHNVQLGQDILEVPRG